MLNPFPLETKQSINVIKNSYCSKYEESLHKSKDVVEYHVTMSTHSTISASSASSASSPRRLISIDHLFQHVFFAISASVFLGNLEVNDSNSPGGKRTRRMTARK